MIITITRSELLEHDPCEDGLALWDQHFGESITMKWSHEVQSMILRSALRSQIGWCVINCICPAVSMVGAYLSGAYLRGADLSRAYLSGADLRGADLSGADLRGADLSGADLRYAIGMEETG